MRFLASDLDGTLVEYNEMIPDNLEGIRQLKEAGHKFIISTGRTYNAVEELIKKYNLDYDYLVLCNGGLIINNKNEIVYDRWIEKEIALEIANNFYNEELAMTIIHNKDKAFLINNPNIDKKFIETKMAKFINFIELKDISDITDIADEYRIMSVFSVEEDCKKAEKIKNSIMEKYGDYVQAFRNQYFVDIVPKGCSKGEGLLKVLELENSTPDNLYVIGDSYNDVSMFNITKNSYTFNSSEEAVKKEANELVDYVHEVVKNILK